MPAGQNPAADSARGGADAVCAFVRGVFPEYCHHLVWLAGGTVRDSLLCRNIRDVDLVAALSAETLERLGFHPVVGKTAGSIWFRNFASFGNLEITRIDAPEFLHDDLRRRDFTVNAMLMTLAGELLDPLGGGSDLKTGRLFPCSKETFSRDPVRIFRAFRFVAEGFSMTEETAALIRWKDWEEDLGRIPVERFSREMLKAFSSPAPQLFFRAMLEFTVGRCRLPELFRMPLVPAGPLHYHPEGDLLAHSLEVLERVSTRTEAPLARFCAFFHDIGKLSTDETLYPRHFDHEETGFAMAIELCKRLALPVSYARALAWTSRLHGKANKFAELRPATRIRMAEKAIKAGITEILPLVASADKPGNRIDEEWRRTITVAAMNAAQLEIDSDKMNALPPVKRAEFVLQKRVERLKTIFPCEGRDFF